MKEPLIEPTKQFNAFSKQHLKVIKLSQQLLAAYHQQKPVNLSDELDIDSAYQVQHLNNQLLEAPDKTRYWKTGQLSDGKVFCAPISNNLCKFSPANFSDHKFNALHVEAELAFHINKSFLAKGHQDSQASDEKILAAIDKVCVAIEILDSRLENWQTANEYLHLADNQMNGALVLGSEIPFDKRENKAQINFIEQTMSLYINDELIVEDKGSHPQQDPTSLLCDFVREANLRGYDIIENSWVTTGTWSGYPKADKGDKVTVAFHNLGDVTLQL